MKIHAPYFILIQILLISLSYSPAIAAEAKNGHPTATVETGHTFITALPWFGQLESSQAVTIPARTDGLVVSIGVADETAVKQGAVLFTLAGKAVESRAVNLRQQLTQANRAVAIARKNLRLKRSQRAQALATNEQVNTAENALSLAQARAAAARQALASLHTGTRITAPTDGVFTARAVHVGQYVSAGMILARIVNPHRLRIRASLFRAPGRKLTGLPAVIHTPHGDVAGVVAATMPETTAEGGLQVWIDSQAIRTMLPGARLSGALTLTHAGIAVPQSAIARDDAGNAYLFIRNGKQWQKQQVVTGSRDGAMVEIRSGLHGGERIATENVYEMLYRNFGSSYHEED